MYEKLIIILIIILVIILILYLLYQIIQSEKFKALRRLCNLNNKQLDAYFNSYNEIFSDNSMVSTLEDYKNNKPPSRFVISKDNKPSEYTANCYSILKDLCALGNIKKMYIPSCIDSNKGVIENQILCEKKIALSLNVKPNGTLLELGCGCGRIAHHISNLTNCKVIGINIDNTQLEDARKYAKKNKTNNEFIFCDFNDRLPFEDNTFDGIYEFGAYTAFISNFNNAFNEIFRILKPDARVIICDVILLDTFNRNNINHLKLLNNARPVMAGGNFIHYKYIEDIAKKAKFEIISSKGGDPPNEASELQLLKNEHAHFGKIETLIKYLTKIYILPNYMNNLIKRLRSGGDDLVELEEKNLLTMCWEFILEKPKN
jgi:sterol 24-C-methyltransferase